MENDSSASMREFLETLNLHVPCKILSTQRLLASSSSRIDHCPPLLPSTKGSCSKYRQFQFSCVAVFVQVSVYSVLASTSGNGGRGCYVLLHEIFYSRFPFHPSVLIQRTCLSPCTESQRGSKGIQTPKRPNDQMAN